MIRETLIALAFIFVLFCILVASTIAVFIGAFLDHRKKKYHHGEV